MLQPNAALWKRLFATIYDTLILIAVSLLYGALATAISTQIFGHTPENYRPNTNGLIMLVGWIVTVLAFYCFFWIKVGQTVAMKAWRIKLVTESGDVLTLQRCIARCALGFAGLAFFGVGYLWSLVDKERCCAHDRLTATRVVQLTKKEA